MTARVRALRLLAVLLVVPALLALPALLAGPVFGDDSAPPGADRPRGDAAPYVLILGVAQDGGLPQAGCHRECCRRAWGDPRLARGVACLAIVDPPSSGRWMVDATPDFRQQLHVLDAAAPGAAAPPPGTAVPAITGILLTHAHAGHYSGLLHLGREALGSRGVPVHVMPRMREFLSANGPWDQLVRLGNITLRPMREDVPLSLGPRLRVTPLLVPHRDEYSETVGLRIEGPGRSVAYIPDIDRWEAWDRHLEDVIAAVDAAYLDGTFYSAGETPGRDPSEIPHPFIVETMRRLAPLPAAERSKVRFIHLNHTNPALRDGSAEGEAIRRAGFRVAEQGERLRLD